jgi:hypothetical protein
VPSSDQTRPGKAEAAAAPPEDDESSRGKKRAEKGKDRKKTKVNFTSCLFFSHPLFPSKPSSSRLSVCSFDSTQFNNLQIFYYSSF